MFQNIHNVTIRGGTFRVIDPPADTPPFFHSSSNIRVEGATFQSTIIDNSAGPGTSNDPQSSSANSEVGTGSDSKALNIDESSLLSSPILVDSRFTHLRLREIDARSDRLVADAIRAFGRTLRCLELQVEGMFDHPIPPHATSLLESAPALDELAIIRYRPSPLPPNWSSSLLTDLLSALGPATPVRALRVCCDEALPQARLDDLGPLPPHLKYIGWDVGPTSLVYVIERRGDNNVVANTLTRVPTNDWTKESVLPFMGESWTQ
ncbi:hypothetical protein MVEN_00716600 [Mycena venus]|uniref:Uncharacterized protein n=1 Tax=Mycena venus TaxID=2733690 RepID=A0A8H7D5T9_9AGAR|nr:hypothetical protein MVEN_00716600 [Mycena venus]